MKSIDKIKHTKRKWLDLTRLSIEFEKTHERGTGKTLHKLIRALQETDLGFNIIYLYRGDLSFYTNYIYHIADAMGFKLNRISKNIIKVDNGNTIEFVNVRNHNSKFKQYGIRNLSIIGD